MNDDFFQSFSSFHVFNSQNETLFLTLMAYVHCSIEFFRNFGKIVVFNSQNEFFVQVDDIPKVSDLIIVEYLKQYRKIRFIISENNFFLQVDYIATMSV